MRIRSRGNEPVVDASAFVAPTAVLVGDVRVGARCRIMYGAVLDSEGSRVEVGPTSIINEHAVLRATAVGDAEGYTIRREDIAQLSPYLTGHIKRFGDYVVDVEAMPEPLDGEMPELSD